MPPPGAGAPATTATGAGSAPAGSHSGAAAEDAGDGEDTGRRPSARGRREPPGAFPRCRTRGRPGTRWPGAGRCRRAHARHRLFTTDRVAFFGERFTYRAPGKVSDRGGPGGARPGMARLGAGCRRLRRGGPGDRRRKPRHPAAGRDRAGLRRAHVLPALPHQPADPRRLRDRRRGDRRLHRLRHRAQGRPAAAGLAGQEVPEALRRGPCGHRRALVPEVGHVGRVLRPVRRPAADLRRPPRRRPAHALLEVPDRQRPRRHLLGRRHHGRRLLRGRGRRGLAQEVLLRGPRRRGGAGPGHHADRQAQGEEGPAGARAQGAGTRRRRGLTRRGRPPTRAPRDAPGPARRTACR
ncbi:hypothetical protein SGPA1_20593 [Streptomyces misionensis JCM 4497]